MTSYTFRVYKDNLHNTIIEQHQTSSKYDSTSGLINRCKISDADVAACRMVPVHCKGILMGYKVGKGTNIVTELPEAFLYLNRAKGISHLVAYRPGEDKEEDVRFINLDVPLVEEDANVITSKCYNQDMYDLPLFDLDWSIEIGKHTNTQILQVNLPVVLSSREATEVRELLNEFGMFTNIGWISDDNTRMRFTAYLGDNAVLVKSTWNWHMYVNQWTPHSDYMYQLQALEEYGILDTFWVEQSVRYGYATLRLPHVKKVLGPISPGPRSFLAHSNTWATSTNFPAPQMQNLAMQATNVGNAFVHVRDNVLRTDDIMKWYQAFKEGNVNGTS